MLLFLVILLLTSVRALPTKTSSDTNKKVHKAAKRSPKLVVALSCHAKTKAIISTANSAGSSDSLESFQSSSNSSNLIATQLSGTTSIETGRTEQDLNMLAFINFENSEDALIDIEEETPVVENTAGVQVVENNTNLASQRDNEAVSEEIPDFDSFAREYISGSSESNGFTWDLETEGQWCLNPIEYQQLKACFYYDNFSSFAEFSADTQIPSLRCDSLSVDRNWPELGPDAPRLSPLSTRFHLLALHGLISSTATNKLSQLFAARLIDFEIPIYEHKSDIYRSFLSFAVEHNRVCMENILTILKYIPRHLINKPTSKSLTPLEVAVMRNNMPLVKVLVEAGADMNIETGLNCKTPFMRAIALANEDIFDYFSSTGQADFNVVLENGTSAYSLAFGLSTLNIFQKILRAAPTPKFRPVILGKFLQNIFLSNKAHFVVAVAEIQKTDSRPLIMILALLAKSAVLKSEYNKLKILHSLKIPMNFITRCRFYPQYGFIHMAASRGDLEMVKLLLNFGISVNELTAAGQSVLHVAYENNRNSVFEELIRRGASVGLVGCIQHAISVDNVVAIDALLLSPLNLDDLILPNGYNFITWAVTGDKPEILEKLLKSGKVNPLKPDNHQQTIYFMQLPENTSERLQNIIKNEIYVVTEVFSDLF